VGFPEYPYDNGFKVLSLAQISDGDGEPRKKRKARKKAGRPMATDDSAIPQPL